MFIVRLCLHPAALSRVSNFPRVAHFSGGVVIQGSWRAPGQCRVGNSPSESALHVMFGNVPDHCAQRKARWESIRVIMLCLTVFAPLVDGITGTLGMRRTRVGRSDAFVMNSAANSRHRSWVEVPTRSPDASREEPADETRRIRIVSYNVLGPRHGMTSKHGHCPLTLRRWTKRSVRLEEEIMEYHTAKAGGLHAVCLQEVTPKTLRSTWVPFMRKLGLDRYVYQPKDPFPKRLYSHRCLGVAVFYSTQHLEKTAEMRVFFPEQVKRLRPNDGGADTGIGDGDGDARVDLSTASRLERDLNSKSDAAVMVRLRLRGQAAVEAGDRGREANKADRQASVTLVCCHLWFDPVRPDLKTAQCRLLFDAIGRFHKINGVLGGDSSFSGGGMSEGAPGDMQLGARGSVGEGRGQSEEPGLDVGGSLAPTNLILCGDFNSVPVVNPAFLPGALKATAERARLADSASPDPEEEPQRHAGFPSIYPRNAATASGVYSLLSLGYVSPTHPEHPDAFIPELLKMEEHAVEGANAWNERLRKGTPADSVPSHRPSGHWSSGFGCALEDVYRDRGVAAPRFTTKTSQFNGVIDHIFVSSGEKDSPLHVTAILGFPPGANLEEGPGRSRQHKYSKDSAIETRDETRDETLEGASGNEIPVDGVESAQFGPIPDELWGSDHLALGVEIAVR